MIIQRHRYYSLSKFLTPAWKFCSSGGAKFGKIDPALEASLREYFRPDVEALEDLLQRDLSAWKVARNRKD